MNGRLPFDPDLWRRLDAVLDRLLDLTGVEREDELAALAAAEPALAEEARRFLVAAAAATDFLDRPAGDVAAALLDESTRAESPGSRLGRRLGAWELTGILGEGGMGVVYAARRCDGQYEAEAAVKLMSSISPASPLRDRLLAERQVLAVLDDPRIARLIDGGVDDEGHPYLVMERVDGHPIDAYCEREGLGLEARIGLFLEVCAAVSSAHRRMILHCDLKPSNVLVTARGELKLLDFGIARNMSGGRAVAAGAEASVHLLTPRYASPEQQAGRPLTAASDVYALGLLLHLLLKGALPGDDASLHGGAPAWSRRLRGDLDNVMAKALAADPAGRYPSPDALAGDLEHWRRRLPVVATPDTFGYRLSRFLARNRPAAAAAAVVALALLAGAGTAVWQARIAARERDQARRDAARAETVSAFMRDIFRSANPNETGGAEFSAGDILRAGRERIDQLAGEPDERSALLWVFSGIQSDLGMYHENLEILETLLADETARFGVDSDEVSEVRIELANTLLELGQWDRASEAIEASLAHRLAHPRPGARWLAIPRSLKARVAMARRDYVTAVALYEQAVAAVDAHSVDEYADAARLLANYGVALSGLGRDATADSVFARALTCYRQAFPDHHRLYGTLYNNWALVAHNLGDVARAEQLHRQALELRRNLRHNQVDIGTSLINLGNLLVVTGRATEAVPLLQEAVRLQREAFGGSHLFVGAAEINLGLALLAQGDHAGADARFRTGEAVMRGLYGDDSSALAVALTRRAQAARGAGDLAGAERLLAEAGAMHRRHQPNSRRQFAETLLEWAEVLQARGWADDARRLAREVAAVLAETGGHGVLGGRVEALTSDPGQ